MSSEGADGRIITFYSYKGGTGRSMALANVAWLLAAAGHRVLAVDWDLEAPGLHRYLHPFLLDPEVTATDGVIDFVTEFVTAAMSPARETDSDWYRPLADLASHAVSLNSEGLFPTGATLDFVPAGRQGPAYASRVNSFDWRNFFDRLGGGRFLHVTAERLRREYDYVLIDSRTGVSDTSGICTVTLPDRLVVCFTLNAQSVNGAAAVTESVLQQREALDNGELLVFPIPMRVELSEHDRLELARTQSRARFDGILSHVPTAKRPSYWGDMEVLYLPIYAYEEVLAVFMERPEQQISVLATLERITGRLTDGAVTAAVPVTEEDRSRVLGRYMRGPAAGSKQQATVAPSEPYVFISGADRDREFVQRLASALASGATPIPVWTAERNLPVGADWDVAIADAIRGAESFVLVVSSEAPSADEWRRAVRYGKVVTPVLIDVDAEIPLRLEGVQAIDMTRDFEAGVSLLRDRLRWLQSPESTGERLQDELDDARRAAEAAPSRSEQAAAQARVADVQERLRRLETAKPSAEAPPADTLRILVRDDMVRASAQSGAEVSGQFELSPLDRRTIEILSEAVPDTTAGLEHARILGAQLHRVLFGGAVGSFLERSLADARDKAGRLQLVLAFGSSADPYVADLPWEYLYMPDTRFAPGSFLATQADIVLSRLEPLGENRPAPVPSHELRVMVVDADDARLDERIIEILRETGVRMVTASPELRGVLSALDAERPSILHLRTKLAGVDSSEAAIRLEQDGEPLWVPVRDVWEVLLSSSPVALVVLDLMASERRTPLLGAAPLRYGGFAVVEVPPAVASTGRSVFFREFYGELLRGEPIDGAVQRARRAMTLYDRAGFGAIRVYVTSPGMPLVAPGNLSQAPVQGPIPRL